MARSVLVTGADTVWGGRLVAARAADPNSGPVVGLGSAEPFVALGRGRFVRSPLDYPGLRDILGDADFDTVLHLSLATDSSGRSSRRLHEINVITTMNLLAAVGRPGTTVRHLVVKSSTIVYGSSPKDPSRFEEATARQAPPGSAVEASLIEAEELVRQFAEENPAIAVSVLRVADALGPDVETSLTRNLARGYCPSIAGFDPLVQFVDEDDVVGAIDHVTAHAISGTYNVAADGVLPWSEAVHACGARLVPLPPIKPAWVAAPLSRLGLLEFPPDVIALLHYGRGVDNDKLKRTGFGYRCTTAGALGRFGTLLGQERRDRRFIPGRPTS
jgi:UDP-glucose 4-epimerase